MKKIILTALLLVMMQMVSVAQNDIQFSNYMFSEITYNPAMAGSSGKLDAALLYRQQWTGFDQAPQTQVLSVNSYVDKVSGGLGLNIINDKLGFEHSLNVKLMYAYMLRLTENSHLSFGLSFGMVNKSLQGSKLIYDDMTDPNAVLNDQTKTKPDFDFGIAYNSKKLAIGLSTTHIAQSLKDATVLIVPRHYYLFAQYKIKASDKINIIPSLKVSTAKFITQVDINAIAYYGGKFWVGAGYRTGDAVIGMLGVDITKYFRLGYSYDYNSGGVKSYSGGSHEVILIGSFDVSKKTVQTKTPRFFN